MAAHGKKTLTFEIKGTINEEFKESLKEIQSSLTALQKAASNGIRISLVGNSVVQIDKMAKTIGKAGEALQKFNKEGRLFNAPDNIKKDYENKIKHVDNMLNKFEGLKTKGMEQIQKTVSENMVPKEWLKGDDFSKLTDKQIEKILKYQNALNNIFSKTGRKYGDGGFIESEAIYSPKDNVLINGDMITLEGLKKRSEALNDLLHGDSRFQNKNNFDEAYNASISNMLKVFNNIRKMRDDGVVEDAIESLRLFEQTNKIDAPVLQSNRDDKVKKFFENTSTPVKQEVNLEITNLEQFKKSLKEAISNNKFTISGENFEFIGLGDKVTKTINDALKTTGKNIDTTKSNRDKPDPVNEKKVKNEKSTPKNIEKTPTEIPISLKFNKDSLTPIQTTINKLKKEKILIDVEFKDASLVDKVESLLKGNSIVSQLFLGENESNTIHDEKAEFEKRRIQTLEKQYRDAKEKYRLFKSKETDSLTDSEKITQEKAIQKNLVRNFMKASFNAERKKPKLDNIQSFVKDVVNKELVYTQKEVDDLWKTTTRDKQNDFPNVAKKWLPESIYDAFKYYGLQKEADSFDTNEVIKKYFGGKIGFSEPNIINNYKKKVSGDSSKEETELIKSLISSDLALQSAKGVKDIPKISDFKQYIGNAMSESDLKQYVSDVWKNLMAERKVNEARTDTSANNSKELVVTDSENKVQEKVPKKIDVKLNLTLQPSVEDIRKNIQTLNGEKVTGIFELKLEKAREQIDSLKQELINISPESISSQINQIIKNTFNEKNKEIKPETPDVNKVNETVKKEELTKATQERNRAAYKADPSLSFTKEDYGLTKESISQIKKENNKYKKKLQENILKEYAKSLHNKGIPVDDSENENIFSALFNDEDLSPLKPRVRKDFAKKFYERSLKGKTKKYPDADETFYSLLAEYEHHYKNDPSKEDSFEGIRNRISSLANKPINTLSTKDIQQLKADLDKNLEEQLRQKEAELTQLKETVANNGKTPAAHSPITSNEKPKGDSNITPSESSKKQNAGTSIDIKFQTNLETVKQDFLIFKKDATGEPLPITIKLNAENIHEQLNAIFSDSQIQNIVNAKMQETFNQMAKSQMETQQSNLENKYKQDFDKAINSKIEEQNKINDAKAAERQAQHDQELQALKANLKQMESLQKESNAKIEDMEKKHSDEMAKIAKENAERIKAIEEESLKERKALEEKLVSQKNKEIKAKDKELEEATKEAQKQITQTNKVAQKEIEKANKEAQKEIDKMAKQATKQVGKIQKVANSFKQKLDKELMAKEKAKQEAEQIPTSKEVRENYNEERKLFYEAVAKGGKIKTSKESFGQDPKTGLFQFKEEFIDKNGVLKYQLHQFESVLDVLTDTGRLSRAKLDNLPSSHGSMYDGKSNTKEVKATIKKNVSELSKGVEGFFVDESTVKTNNGITTFSADVLDAQNNVQTLKFSVENFLETISKEGNIEGKGFSKSFIKNFSKVTDEQKAIVDKQTGVILSKYRETPTASAQINEYNKTKAKLEAAVKQSDIKMVDNSFKANPDGTYQFMQAIVKKNGELQTIARTFKDIKDITTYDGKLYERGFERQKFKPNNIKTEKFSSSTYNRYAAQQIKELSKNSGEFELLNTSIKTKNNGVMVFKGQLLDADETIKNVTVSVQDLFKVINNPSYVQDGSFTSKFFKDFSTFDIDQEKLKSIKDTILKNDKKIATLSSRETANELGSPINNRLQKLSLEQEQNLQKYANVLKKGNLKEEEVEKALTNLQSKRNRFYRNPEIFSENARNAYARNKKVEAINLFNPNRLFDDEVVDENNKSFRPKIEFIKYRNELNRVNAQIDNGEYANKSELQSLLAEHQRLLDLAKAYNKEMYHVSNNKGFLNKDNFVDFGKNLGDASFKERARAIENYIKQVKDGVKNIKVVQRGSKGDTYRAMFQQDGITYTNDYQITQLRNTSNQYQHFVREMEVAQKSEESVGQKWMTGLKHKLSTLTQYVTGARLVGRAMQEIREGFAFVSQMDSLMTTIYQTSDISSNGIKELSQGAIDQAKALGTTTEQVSGAIEVYAAYGETVDSLLKKAEPTTMLAKATGADIKTSSDQIQGVLQQFTELEGQETKIVNAYEKIGANIKQDFGVAVQNVAQGVQTAGSVAKEAGLSFEQFAAIVAKTSETTRLEGSQIGNAMKTIMARTSRSKSADPDTTNEERSAAAKALKSVDIEIYDKNGKYQDFGKTMDMLAEKWDTLTDAQRANIAESIAGTRNINIMQTMISKWTESMELANEVEKDPSFYLDVHKKSMNSMQSKMDTFKANTQDLWHNFLDIDYLKTGISIISGITNSMSDLLKVLKKLTPVIGKTGSGTALVGIIASAVAAARNIQAVRTTLKGVDGSNAENVGLLTGYATGIKNTINEAKKVGLRKNTYNSYWAAFKDGGVKNVVKNMTATAKSIAAIGGAFLAFEAIKGTLDYFTTSSVESADAVRKAVDEVNALSKQVSAAKSVLSDSKMMTEWEHLNKGVSNGKNISLTTEEFARYHEITNKIAETMPNLVNRFDEQGNAILKNVSSVRELNDEYKKLKSNRAMEDVSNYNAYKKNFKNNTNKKGFFHTIWDQFFGNDDEDEIVVDLEHTIELFQKINKFSQKEMEAFIRNPYDFGYTTEHVDWLNKIGITKEKVEKNFDEVLNTVQSKLNVYRSKFKAIAEPVKQEMQNFIYTLFDKDKKSGKTLMSEDDYENIAAFIGNIDEKQLLKLFNKDIDFNSFASDIYNSLKNDTRAKIALDDLINLDPHMNIDKMSKVVTENIDILNNKLTNMSRNNIVKNLDLKDEIELIKKFKSVEKDFSEKFEINSDFKNELDQINQYAKEYNKLTNGNVDYNKRPIVKADKMWEAGWDKDKTDLPKNDMITTYSSGYTGDINGKNIHLEVTPILENGEVLSPDALNSYVDELFASGDPLKSDYNKLVISQFENPSVEELEKYYRQLGAVKQAHASVFTTSYNKSEILDVWDKYKKKIRVTKKEFDSFIKKKDINTQQEVDLLAKLIRNIDSWSEIESSWKLESARISDYSGEIENLQTTIDTTKESLQELVNISKLDMSSTGLDAAAIKQVEKFFSSVKDYDRESLFDITASGIRLNTKELARLNAEYEKQQSEKYSNALKKLTSDYQDLCVAISEASDPSVLEKDLKKRDSLSQQIDKVRELAAQYDGLTNSISDWQRAQETSNSGELYDKISEGLEKNDNLWNKSLTGTDDFKSYVQMFTNKDLASEYEKDAKAYENAWVSAHDKVVRYFTKDESKDKDGNYSAGLQGSKNFLEDMVKKGFAALDNAGNYSFENMPSIKTLSKAFDMKAEVIEALLLKLKDYNFNIEINDDIDKLRELREEAIKSSKTISESDKQYKFNLDLESIKDLKNEIAAAEKAKKELVISGDLRLATSVDDQIRYLKAKLGELVKDYIVNVNFTDNRDILEKDLKILKSISKYKELNIDFNLNNVKEAEDQVDKLGEVIKDFVKDGHIDFKATGAKETLDLLVATQNELARLQQQNTVVMTLRTEGMANEKLASTIDGLKQFISTWNLLQTLNTISMKYGIELDTSGVKEQVTAQIQQFKDLVANDKQYAEIFSKLGIDLNIGDVTVENFDKIEPKVKTIADGILGINQKAIDSIKDIKTEATKPTTLPLTPKLDKKAFSKLVIPSKEIILIPKLGTVTDIQTNPYNASSNVAPAPKKSTKSKRKKGKQNSRGTQNFPATGRSLVGELGRELLIRGSNWYTVGENGAEFVELQQGDIIIDHLNTEDLLKNGKAIHGNKRGGLIGSENEFAKGTAFARGKAYNNGYSPHNNPTYGVSGSFGGGYDKGYYGNNSGKSNSDKSKDFKDVIDYIEILIDRIERKIKKLNTVMGSAFRSWTERSKAVADSFHKISQEIDVQRKAEQIYLAKANSVGLSEVYKQKIRDGKLQIEDITNEDLKKNIDDFKKWYEKALDCNNAIVQLQENLSELAKTKFDHVASQFDAVIDTIQHKADMLEGELSIIENKGMFAGSVYYTSLVQNAESQANELQKKYNDLIKARDEGVASGQIIVGTEAYAEMTNQINEVAKAFQDAKNSALEFKNQMWEMDWGAFDWGQEQIQKVIDESNFLRELWATNENDLFVKETGKFSQLGLASGATHAMDYNLHMGKADEYGKKVAEINKKLATDPNNKILIDKKNEYLEAQRESILAAQNEKKEIQSLYKTQYDKMLEVLDKLIKKRKDLLQSEKDLYDYEKNVAEQVKNIGNLKKQLWAIEGDDSEENKAHKQQLKDELQKAEQNLEETQYDRWLSDQTQLMDKMREDYEQVLNERLDQINLLLTEMINYGNTNASSINQTIQTSTSDVGYKVTEGLTSIWNTTDSGLGKVMTDYSANFGAQLTTVNEYLKSILAKIVAATEGSKKPTTPPKVTAPSKPAASSKPKPQQTPTAPKPTPTPKPTVHVGGRINARGATIYSTSSGGGAGTQYYGHDPIYTVVGERNGFVLARWHGLSYGYTGWFRKGDVTALNTGGYTGNQEGIAMLHKKERVLNASQTKAFEHLVYDFLPKISTELTRVDNISKSSIVNKTIGSSQVENTIDLTFNLPNVKDSSDLIKTLQTDKNIQKVIQSFTIDEALGKNTLRKFRVK